MKLTPGKQKGLKAVSNSRDVIAAAAMDQRGSLKSAIAKEKGGDKNAVTSQMLEEFKTAVVKVLTPHASAILLDPEYGLPASHARAKNAGLLLAYENSGYNNTPPPPPPTTITSPAGSNASARSASPRTFRFFSNWSVTKRAETRRASLSRKRS